MSDLSVLQKRAMEIRQKYQLLNRSNNFDKWGGKEYAMGLVGDTGDLVKLVMAKENLREIENADQKIRHELADCLWSLLVIADYYNVDLQKSFLDTMNELEKRIEAGK